MSNRRLASAPLIITDIPTNYLYGIQHTYLQEFTEIVTAGDSTTRYYTINNDAVLPVIRDICLVPNSFRESEYQKGPVIACWRTTDDVSIRNRLDIFVHKPVGDLTELELSNKWKQVADATQTIFFGNFGEGETICRLFSQRQGEWVYAVISATTENTGTLAGYRFNHTGYAVEWLNQDIGFSEFGTPIPILDINGQFHISDDESPFIWHTTAVNQDYDGFHIASSNDGLFSFGFVEDGTDIGTITFDSDHFNIDNVFTSPGTGYHFSGKSGAFRQKFQLPSNTYGTGPILVDPWAEGSYGAPELWWFILKFDIHGNTTGAVDVYRSQWKKRQYVRYPQFSGTRMSDLDFMQFPVTLDDDTDYNDGVTNYPALNPDGFGFENDWYNTAHKVTTLNFGIPIYNPSAGGTAQNTTNMAGGAALFFPNAFRVVRDRRRLAVQHMVVSGLYMRSLPGVDTPAVYYSVSTDDGASWGRFTPVQPSIPDGILIDTPDRVLAWNTAFDRISVENLFSGDTVMPIGLNIVDELSGGRTGSDNGSRATLLAVDYTAQGVGEAEVSPAIFKRGELKRASWV